jgi:hypothetical protein
MRGQSGSGTPKKRKIGKKVAKKVEKTDKLVLIQTGGGKISHVFDSSHGQANLVHNLSARNVKQLPTQKPVLPRIVQLRAEDLKGANTIPNQRLVSGYL